MKLVTIDDQDLFQLYQAAIEWCNQNMAAPSRKFVIAALAKASPLIADQPLCGKIIRPGMPWICNQPVNHLGSCLSDSSRPCYSK